MLQSLEILNLEGHPNRITDSRVTAIFLYGWILPIRGASAVEGLRSMGLPRLVYTGFNIFISFKRLSVARTVLQTSSKLIYFMIFSKNI